MGQAWFFANHAFFIVFSNTCTDPINGTLATFQSTSKRVDYFVKIKPYERNGVEYFLKYSSFHVIVVIF